MAHRLSIFTLADDELALLRLLERSVFEVYPRRVPPDWVTFRAAPDAWERLPEDELYLVASDVGPALVDPIKRGRDKGSLRIDEVRSPVVFWGRSRMNDEGELLSGQLWAELDVTPETGRSGAGPERFRARFLELEGLVRKSFRRSDPKGHWIGPAAARATREGKLVLREDEHFGRTVRVHR